MSDKVPAEVIGSRTTTGKALRVNLDMNIYGAFAEIGAGQKSPDISFRPGEPLRQSLKLWNTATQALQRLARLSNLGADKYERWLNHPVQRTLVMGGATISFCPVARCGRFAERFLF